MVYRRGSKKTGFSLVELVIVIVIIGVIAAIAIPRVSQASRAAGESALSSNLSVLRNAIELYASEHSGVYPGATSPGGGVSKETPEAFVAQLTKYTKEDGTSNDTKTTDYCYGPYLRKDIPPVPVGDFKGANNVLIDLTNSPPAVSTTKAGWVYNPKSGDLVANSDARNEADTKDYNEY